MKMTILALLLFTQFAQAKTVERVLAVVEGQMILASEVDSFSAKLRKKNLVNENLITFLKLNQTNPSNKDVLNYLVSKKVITAFALKDLNLTSTESVIETEIGNLAKQNKISTSQLKTEITSRGIDYEDYRQFIGESSLVRSAIEKHVVSQVRPTEEDFVSYLKENGVNNIEPSYLFDLDQIYISKKASDAEKLAKSINSKNFKKYFSSAQSFGFQAVKLGALRASDLSSTHSKSLIQSSEGTISKVFEEASGYRIFYINLKKGNFKIPNTDKIKNLQKSFYDTKIQEQFSLWMSEIRPSFFVRLNK
jgi:peptidyl-prolyl cis-trans isomerase SurA